MNQQSNYSSYLNEIKLQPLHLKWMLHGLFC